MQPQAQSDRILSICKLFSPIVFNSLGNLPHPGPIPTCSDIEIIALSLFNAKSQIGLFTRIILKVTLFTMLQYINLMNNQPLNQMRYTLSARNLIIPTR